jgi:hypothetical protein
MRRAPWASSDLLYVIKGGSLRSPPGARLRRLSSTRLLAGATIATTTTRTPAEHISSSTGRATASSSHSSQRTQPRPGDRPCRCCLNPAARMTRRVTSWRQERPVIRSMIRPSRV